MRSKAGDRAGQGELPLEVAAAPRRTPSARRAADRPVRHRLEAAACGWPAGTELVAEPGRRPERGDAVLVREGGRTLVGTYRVRFGRPFLVADREAVWLGPAADVLGVVTVVAPPLLSPECGAR